MSNELENTTNEIIELINKQNKKFEHLDLKIEDIIKGYLKEEKINNLVGKTPNINLSDANFVENIKFEDRNKIINEKFIVLEEENKNLKEKLISLEEKIEKLNKNENFYKKLEEKLNLLEENNKVTTDIEVSGGDSNDLSKNDFAVKKDGKVVNIVINV